ncbi:MAG TPA: LacI family DNA-binding transcriptional regulator [Jatrophihabitans sp.]|jgi:DNA-binding LacI/PurR family transcriptional regulator
MASDRPTLDTVAAVAGVSRMTVSNAYNRPDQLSAATRERVLAAAATLGYAGPDPTAASLRRQRTGTIGVILTERLPYAFTDPGMVEILRGMTTELSDAGMSLLLVPESGGEDDSSNRTAELLRHAMVDALVLCSLDPGDPAVAAAQERKVPLVTIGHPKLPHVPMVGIDNEKTAAMVAPYLYGLGHRRFAVLTVGAGIYGIRNRPGFISRPSGFIDELTRLGVKAEDVVICEASEHSRSAGKAAVGALLATPTKKRPTALFAVTDILALGAMDAAAGAGVDVPGELSIAGIDDIPDAAAASPPLTTIDQELFEQGRAAIRLALRQLAGEPVRAPRTKTELLVRGSTAAPPR